MGPCTLAPNNREKLYQSTSVIQRLPVDACHYLLTRMIKAPKSGTYMSFKNTTSLYSSLAQVWIISINLVLVAFSTLR